MRIKIENQEQLQERIKYFVEKYSNDFNEKVNVPGCDKDYVRTRFERDVLQKRLNEIYASKDISNAHHFRNEAKWLKGLETFEAIQKFCEEQKLKNDFQQILELLGEYDAIFVHYYEILGNKLITPDAKVETIEEFVQNVQEKENIFCRAMPLKVPIEHFRVFVDQKNKSGRSYLTESEFISFINRAFLNSKSINMVTLNIGSGEKLFVTKRFYEFYLKGIEYENSSQCKDKYIKLVTDNFTNWTYENLKNNFGNKVKRQW